MTKSVLIIDDDRKLCDLVAELLGEEGFRVEIRLPLRGGAA